MVREGLTEMLPLPLKLPDIPEMVTEVALVLHVRVAVLPGWMLLGLAEKLLMTGDVDVEVDVDVEDESVDTLGLAVGVATVGARPAVPEALGLAVAVGVPAGVGVDVVVTVFFFSIGATTSRVSDHGVHSSSAFLPRMRNS